MKSHIIITRFLTVLFILTAMVYMGCEKKAGDSNQKEVTSETLSSDTTSSVATEGEPGIENEIQIPDIKGTWTGTFDKRATTLNITEQTDSSFSGKITISYREVINQEVKGTFSPATFKMTMIDQLRSRYQGSYSGMLSKELNNFSGTFTMKVDGSKFSFNLNKK